MLALECWRKVIDRKKSFLIEAYGQVPLDCLPNMRRPNATSDSTAPASRLSPGLQAMSRSNATFWEFVRLNFIDSVTSLRAPAVFLAKALPAEPVNTITVNGPLDPLMSTAQPVTLTRPESSRLALSTLPRMKFDVRRPALPIAKARLASSDTGASMSEAKPVADGISVSQRVMKKNKTPVKVAPSHPKTEMPRYLRIHESPGSLSSERAQPWCPLKDKLRQMAV